MTLARLVPVLMAAVFIAVSCSESAPEVPETADGPDPVLEQGRSIYTSRCQSCHGSDGGGGRGARLNGGRVLESFPEAEDQIRFVAEGRGGMPSFDGSLDEDELAAVVAYTREVLAVQD